MFTKEKYIARRKKLKELVKDGIVVMFGNSESPMNYTGNPYKFRQDSHFLYYFGLNYPDLIGVFDYENDKEYLVGDEEVFDDLIWSGTKPTLDNKAMLSGVDNFMFIKDFENFIRKALVKKQQVHLLPVYSSNRKIKMAAVLDISPYDCIRYASKELIKAIVKMRSVKDNDEINEIEEALSNITYDMYIAALQNIKPGIKERKIEGIMEGVALQKTHSLSYIPIITTQGEVLHNHYYENEMTEGDILLIDAGADSKESYATDITRTFPVSGKFNKAQREIYEIVLRGQKKAIGLIKPGTAYKDIHLETAKEMAGGLIDLGLMKGNVEDVVREGAHALFFPHGLGHMMGLDVHDMEDLGEEYVGYDDTVERSEQFGLAYLRMAKKLEPGFVLTVEPGLYFIPPLMQKWRDEGLHRDFINYGKLEDYTHFGGIRIEDDVLVTENGNAVLGQPIPKEIDEIEKIMKG